MCFSCRPFPWGKHVEAYDALYINIILSQILLDNPANRQMNSQDPNPSVQRVSAPHLDLGRVRTSVSYQDYIQENCVNIIYAPSPKHVCDFFRFKDLKMYVHKIILVCKSLFSCTSLLNVQYTKRQMFFDCFLVHNF